MNSFLHALSPDPYHGQVLCRALWKPRKSDDSSSSYTVRGLSREFSHPWSLQSGQSLRGDDSGSERLRVSSTVTQN